MTLWFSGCFSLVTECKYGMHVSFLRVNVLYNFLHWIITDWTSKINGLEKFHGTLFLDLDLCIKILSIYSKSNYRRRGKYVWRNITQLKIIIFQPKIPKDLSHSNFFYYYYPPFAFQYSSTWYYTTDGIELESRTTVGHLEQNVIPVLLTDHFSNKGGHGNNNWSKFSSRNSLSLNQEVTIQHCIAHDVDVTQKRS